MKLILAILCTVSVCVGQSGIIYQRFDSPKRYHFSGVYDTTEVSMTTVGGDTTKAFSPFSAVMVFTLLQTWDAYVVWCADSVQKRGWDSWVFDSDAPQKDSIKIGGRWLVGSYFAKVQHNHYRDVREKPSIYGYIEWLRNKAKGAPQ